ncbi:hypothetical protein ACSBR1_002536 [Camellia fascicularis]
MQRPTNSNRACDDHHVIDIMQESQAKHSPRRKTEGLTDLPLFEGPSLYQKMSRSRSSEKWIHVIPVIVFLCIFILWWFSYPVNLEFKDGRIMAVHRIEMADPLDETRVEFTILASTTPPNTSISQIPTLSIETEAQPVSPTD